MSALSPNKITVGQHEAAKLYHLIKYKMDTKALGTQKVVTIF